MPNVLKLFIALIFLFISACAPLPPEPTNTSTPEKLSEVLVKSFIQNKESLFEMDILLTEEGMADVVSQIKEKGNVSVNPRYTEGFAEIRQSTISQWQKVRKSAERDGVLWSGATFYGCKYKMRQNEAFLPISKNFEIYIQSGGYFYRIDLTSITHNEDYYVFDSLKWVGEVAKPETISTSESE